MKNTIENHFVGGHAGAMISQAEVPQPSPKLCSRPRLGRRAAGRGR
jgi:hypothetical protein